MARKETPEQILLDLAHDLGLTKRRYSRLSDALAAIPSWAMKLSRMLGEKRQQSQLEAAQRLLEAAGYRIDSRTDRIEPPPIPSGRTPIPPPINTPPTDRGRSQPPPPPRNPDPTAPPPVQQPPGYRGHFGFDSRAAYRPGETREDRYGVEVLTPQSSNVYSFSYRTESSTLFVTYKASEIHNVRVGAARKKGGSRQLRSQGGVHGKKLDSAGARYAYLDVPKRVYDRMILAQSKGKFVWDELRVRGTIYGHKFRYLLWNGAVTGGGNLYIPRRATPQGFALRSIAGAATRGVRNFRSSTLPAQQGFSTRRRIG